MSTNFQAFKWLLVFLLLAKASQAQSLPEDGSYPLLKDEALVVLKNNCNTCHKRMNPSKLFTEENMEEFAPLIHEQVFVKKRMPLGFWNKLEEEDAEKLRRWLKANAKRKAS